MAGGRNSGQSLTSKTEIYSTSTMEWISIGPIPTARRNSVGISVRNNLFVLGKNRGLNAMFPLHRASFMFNFLSNLFCFFFILLRVEVQKKEQKKIDKKLNIKDARCKGNNCFMLSYL